VAIAYKYLGALLERNGDRESALVNYRKAVALDEVRARANEHDRQTHLDLSFGYASIGYALSAMGDTAGSLENYQRALSLREQVAAADPHDVNARDTVVRAHLSIGEVLRNAGRSLEAIDHYRKALDIASARFTADPTNGAVGERLANVYRALARANAGLAAATKDTAEAARRWRQARAWARNGLEIWEKRRATGPLTEGAQGNMDSLVDLVAKCETALAALAH
jgi:tetratricopeptide (TPR) repeat protein